MSLLDLLQRRLEGSNRLRQRVQEQAYQKKLEESKKKKPAPTVLSKTLSGTTPTSNRGVGQDYVRQVQESMRSGDFGRAFNVMRMSSSQIKGDTRRAQEIANMENRRQEGIQSRSMIGGQSPRTSAGAQEFLKRRVQPLRSGDRVAEKKETLFERIKKRLEPMVEEEKKKPLMQRLGERVGQVITGPIEAATSKIFPGAPLERFRTSLGQVAQQRSLKPLKQDFGLKEASRIAARTIIENPDMTGGLVNVGRKAGVQIGKQIGSKLKKSPLIEEAGKVKDSKLVQIIKKDPTKNTIDKLGIKIKDVSPNELNGYVHRSSSDIPDGVLKSGARNNFGKGVYYGKASDAEFSSFGKPVAKLDSKLKIAEMSSGDYTKLSNFDKNNLPYSLSAKGYDGVKIGNEILTFDSQPLNKVGNEMKTSVKGNILADSVGDKNVKGGSTNHTGIIAEKKTNVNSAEEFVKTKNPNIKIGSIDDFFNGKSDVALRIQDGYPDRQYFPWQKRPIVLTWIESKKKGTGVGSKIVNDLKTYADSTGRPLEIANVSNEKFWDKFDFLKKEGGEYVYKPSQSQPLQGAKETIISKSARQAQPMESVNRAPSRRLGSLLGIDTKEVSPYQQSLVNRQRQATTDLIRRQGEKISDLDIQRFREQNLLGPETVDEILLRKRGIITDKQAVDRAKRYKMTIDDIVNAPPGTVVSKEKLTAMSQVVQQERQVNQSLRRLAEGGGVASQPSERELIKNLGGRYTNLTEEQLVQSALQENTLKLKKAEIALMAAKSEAGRSLQGAKQAIDAVDSRMRIVYDSMKKRTPLEQEAILQRIAKEPIEDTKNFIKLLDDLNDADFFDKFAEFSVAAKLWNPTTHIVNLGSNVVRQVADVVITGISNPRLAKADALGAYSGLKQGLKSALRAMTDEGYASQLSKYIETGGKMSAIKGRTGKIVRAPFRALGASDEIFKGIAYQRSLYRQAMREAGGNAEKMKQLLEAPTFKMMNEATEQAKRMTYQEDMGEIVKKINKFRDPSQYTAKAGKTMGVVSRMFLSFLKTPVNLFKQSVDFSPIGFVKNRKLIVEGFKKGGTAKEEAMRRIGEAVLGTGITAWGISEAMDGRITGAAPKDAAEKELFYKEGKQPYSIKIGNRWVQYKRIEPFSTTLGATADFYNLKKEDDLALGTIVNKITNQLSDKTYLQGVSDLINLLTGEEWEQKSAAQGGILGSLLPSIVGHTARSTDTVIRETQTFGERAKAQIPWFSRQLPAKHDIFGQVKERSQEPWWSYFLNPIRTSEESSDPIIKEMRRLQDEGYGVVPSLQDNTMGDVKLDGRQKQDFQKLYGEKTRRAYEEIINDPIYDELNDADRQNILDTAVKQEREWAKQELFGTGQIPKQSWRDKLNKMGLIEEEGLEMDMLQNSERVIRFKNTAEELKQKLTTGSISEFYDQIDGLSREEQDVFGDIKTTYPEFKDFSPYTKYDNPTSQKAENTRTFKERLFSDHPEEGIRFFQKLDKEEQERILGNMDNKGNEEWLKKYQEATKVKAFSTTKKPEEEINVELNYEAPYQYKEDISSAASESGVPENILTNLLYQESNFREDVITGKTSSPVGAQGIAQFMPDTAKSMGIDPLDPKQAIPAAAKYLKQLYDKFGNWEHALGAYNWGEGNMRSFLKNGTGVNGQPMPEETKKYISSIAGGKVLGASIEKTSANLVPISTGTKIDIPGTKRDEGQCGAFVNDYLGKREFGDSYQQKRSKINSNTPKEGAIAIIPTRTPYGHVAVVEGVNEDGTVNVVEANWKNDRTVGRRTVDPKTIEGYYIPGEPPKPRFAAAADKTISKAVYYTPAEKERQEEEAFIKEREEEDEFEKAFDMSGGYGEYQDKVKDLHKKVTTGRINHFEYMRLLRQLNLLYRDVINDRHNKVMDYYRKYSQVT